jgi:hypothetical protein
MFINKAYPIIPLSSRSKLVRPLRSRAKLKKMYIGMYSAQGFKEGWGDV